MFLCTPFLLLNDVVHVVVGEFLLASMIIFDVFVAVFVESRFARIRGANPFSARTNTAVAIHFGLGSVFVMLFVHYAV